LASQKENHSFSLRNKSRIASTGANAAFPLVAALARLFRGNGFATSRYCLPSISGSY